MPDGGSDCCMTCWFNSTHEGKRGYLPDPHKLPVRCTIRDFDVESIAWTYCANHPHHTAAPVRLPIGPVLTCGSYPYDRMVLIPSPDSEEIRTMLLGLIESMPERYEERYRSRDTVGDAAVKQLGVFREPRAVPALRRILAFDPLALAEGADSDSTADRTRTVGLAAEALAAILGDEALPELLPRTQAGRAEADAMPEYDPFQDRLASVRAFAVRGLRHVSPAAASNALQAAVSDPHPWIQSIAEKLLAGEPVEE